MAVTLFSFLYIACYYSTNALIMIRDEPADFYVENYLEGTL